MKRSKLIVLIVMLVTIAGSYNIFNHQKKDGMSDIMLANIEALARAELGTNDNCALWIQYGGSGIIRQCITCQNVYFVSSFSGLDTCWF